MRRILAILVLAALAGLGVLASLATMPAHSVAAASCTQLPKQHAQAALRTFEARAAAKRRGYFRTHRSKAARRAYDRKQQATLKRLHAAAACTDGAR